MKNEEEKLLISSIQLSEYSIPILNVEFTLSGTKLIKKLGFTIYNWKPVYFWFSLLGIGVKMDRKGSGNLIKWNILKELPLAFETTVVVFSEINGTLGQLLVLMKEGNQTKSDFEIKS